MARNLERNRGFTLVEILVVMAILILVSGIAMTTDVNTYQRYSFRSDRDALISTLHRARSQSINKICFSSCTSMYHGIYFATNQYTLFQGPSYATRDVAVDEVIDINSTTHISGPSEVVFAPLSGEITVTPSGSWNLIISDDFLNSSTITLQSLGQIKWTN
jgi:prepilin-type N-terminal cleavage/methylation domain-containing protein